MPHWREIVERRRESETYVTLADGPWPEAIAGAAMGGVFASYLAVYPEMGAFMSTRSGLLVVLAIGVLVGAAVSCWMNRGPRQVKVRREVPIREDRAAA